MSNFDHLLKSLCELSGQDSSGLEGGVLRLEIDGREASVLPARTPAGDEAIEITVSAGALTAADEWDEVDVLSLLHRVNVAARYRHDWLATLDEDDQMMIKRVRPLEGLSPSDLELLVAEGVDRAASLQGLVSRWVAAEDGADGAAPNAPESNSMIRV